MQSLQLYFAIFLFLFFSFLFFYFIFFMLVFVGIRSWLCCIIKFIEMRRNSITQWVYKRIDHPKKQSRKKGKMPLQKKKNEGENEKVLVLVHIPDPKKSFFFFFHYSLKSYESRYQSNIFTLGVYSVKVGKRHR